MQNIEQQVSENYINNMKFFEDNYFNLWKKLYELSTDIELQRYEEKYALDYLDGYFDVMQTSSQNYLYADNSQTISTQLSKQVNYKKDSFVFDGFPLYYQYEKGQKDFTDKVKGLEDIYPLMTYYLDRRNSSNEMVDIEKFIFLGVGLGMHILEVDAKIDAEEYFIIEDDLELFRLSLFTTPYYKLKGKTLFFSIADSNEDFNTRFRIFLEDSFFRNKYLKYLHFPAHTTHKINLIKNALASQAFVSFPYKTNLDKYIRTLSYVNSGFNFLNLSKRLESTKITSKPLLIIASGPSLDNNIEWLRENHSKFLILALSATLKVLFENKIVPDIVTHLDGFKPSIKHLQGFDQKEFLKDTLAIVGSFTPPEVLTHFTKKNIYIIEDHSTFYHKDFNASAGPCIGSSSIMWSVTMGFEEIYLLGIDLALAKSGASHSYTHQLTKKTYETKKDTTISSNISFRGDTFKIKGNFREKVDTTPLFYVSVLALDNSLKQIKNDSQKIYNLNDGAYLQNTISLHSKDVDFATFTKQERLQENQLKEFLQPYVKEILDKEDIASLHKRLAFTKEIKSIVLEYQNRPLASQKEHYLYNLISLALAILKDETRENRNLVTLYNLYLDYTMPIIFDFFNTKKTKDTKRDIKKIDKMFLKGMIDIEKIYEEALMKFLNTKV